MTLLCPRRKYMTMVPRGLELYIKFGSWHSSISLLAFCSRKHLLNSDKSQTLCLENIYHFYMNLRRPSSELQCILLQPLPAHNEMSQSPNERYCMNVCNTPFHNFLLLPGYKKKHRKEIRLYYIKRNTYTKLSNLEA